MYSHPKAAQCYGLDDCSIDYATLAVPIHRDIAAPLRELQQRAGAHGFDLQVASGYRDFERQLAIWNRKADGAVPVLDDNGRPLMFDELNPWQQVQAILRWSALPGTSRHHWGTDIDVYDAAAVNADYRVQLTPDEVADSGPFGPMHHWLDKQMARATAEGFFRPYAVDRGGVAPERWHLSYAPIAQLYEAQFSIDMLAETLAAKPLALKDVVLSHLDEIVDRYLVCS